jgi:hypothetical protein
MTEPALQLKVELFHKPRDDTDVPKAIDRIKHGVNHPHDRISDLEFSVGHRATAAFVTLKPKQWKDKEINKVLVSLVMHTEHSHYAKDVRVHDWQIEHINDEN